MTSPGRNAGITGLIDLPEVGPKFSAFVGGWERKLDAGDKLRAGRGTTGSFAASRPILSSGNLIVTARLMLDGWPMPSQWRGERGTVTIQYDEGRTETVPIQVRSVEHTYNAEGRNAGTTFVTFTARVTGTPTLVGFGGDADAA